MEYKGTTTPAHLETIYQVMIKRIAKGFTAKRLSFFISEDEDYIEQVESLQLPVYSTKALELIAEVLEENNLKSFYSDSDVTTQLNVIVEKETLNNKLLHSYFLLDKDLVPCPLFKLKEDVSAELDEKADTCTDMELAADAFDLLLRSSYLFEGKSAPAIYKAINGFISPPLNPLYIEMAIGRACGKGGLEKELKMLDDVLHGRRYEEC